MMAVLGVLGVIAGAETTDQKPGAVPEEGLLFYASFDQSFHADVARGEAKGFVEGRTSRYLVEGIHGKGALVGGGDTELKYSLPGNLDPAQGTVSLYAFSRDFDLGDSFFHVFFEAFAAKNMLVLYKFFSTPNNLMFVIKPQVDQPGHCQVGSGHLDWPRGLWRHLAITWDAQAMTLYVDGQKRPSVKLDAPLSDLGPYFYVGASCHRWNYRPLSPDTVIDELRIYDRPLNAAQIVQLARQWVTPAATQSAKQAESPAVTRKAIPASAWCVQKTRKPPTIDGQLADGEWDDATTLSGLISLDFKRLSMYQARYFITYDDQNLYVALDSPAMEGLRFDPRRAEIRDDGEIALGDAMEVYLDPGRTGNTVQVFQFLGSATGSLYDRRGNDLAWNGHWRFENHVQDNHWTAELAIPFADLGRETPKPGEVWGVNLCRNFTGDIRWTSLVPTSYGQADQLIPIRFETGSIAVHSPLLLGLNHADKAFSWTFRNTGPSGKSLRVFSRLYDTDGVVVNQKENEQLLIDGQGEQSQRFDFSDVAAQVRSGETYWHELAVQEGRAGGEIFQAVTPFKYVESGAQSAKLTPEQLAAQRADLEKTWKNNQLGVDHRVPPPWTPVQVDGDRVQVWGRTYDLAAGGLPQTITTRDRSILAGPIALRMRGDKDRPAINLASMPTQLVSREDDAIERLTQGTQGPWDVILRCRVEFDGMIRYDLTLAPKTAEATPLKLSELALEIPLSPDVAVYTHSFLEKWQSTFSGRIPEEGIQLPFRRQIWIGDEELGLAWFAPSARNWKTQGPAIVGVREKDRYILRIVMVDQDKTLDKPATFTFGLMATPVKPRPRDWRKYQDMRQSPHPIPGVRPWISIWRFEPAFSTPIPARPDFFDNKVQQYEAAGNLVLNYASPNFMGKIPYDADKVAAGDYHQDIYLEGVDNLYRLFYPLWCSIPQNDRGNHASVCPCSQWTDFLVWAIEQLRARHGIEGVYFDNCFVNSCSNDQHGCGYFDDAGVQQAEYPIFAQRELKKRIYKLFKLQSPPRETLIVDHTSALIDAPLLSFCDIAYNGEQVQLGPTDDYYEFFSPDKIRTEFTFNQWGYIPLMMSMFKTDLDRVQQLPQSTEQFHGIALLHDIPVTLNWCNHDAGNRYYRMMKEFGLVESQFTPYWHRPVACDRDEVKVSVFQRPGKALLIVGNQSPRQQKVILTLDTKTLGLAKLPAAAEDLYHGALFLIRDGQMSVTVDRYNFRALEVAESN
ncbi:MAG: hypothetical protein IT440_06720 [Phycisphaeraceae bacterium]|nr:hypothetical protein [Phycisphaeraceae bacterium]